MTPSLRDLTPGDRSDVAGGGRDGSPHIAGQRRRLPLPFRWRDLQRPVIAIERTRKTLQGRIAAAADARQDLVRARRGCAVPDACWRQQLVDGPPIRGRNNPQHYTTILFSGYSTMPWPPASFKRGIRSRAVFSSRIVLIATHSGSLSDDTVGRCRAGRSAMSLSRSARFALSINPTRPCASIAALRSSARFSILVFFHGSPSAPALAINCVLDSMMVARIRSRLARSVDPVSVASTIASASTGGFTSVAPHENSTSTVRPFDVK